MRDVYFTDPSIYKLDFALERALDHCNFPTGGRVAIKVHMGEYGNLYYLRPSIIGRVVGILKEKGYSPFLFDTPTLYEYMRHSAPQYYETARKNGYTEETMGCPIVISDDSYEINTPYSLDRVGIPIRLLNSSCLVAISHLKGHRDAGFGGAIKNLGMGCVDMKTKQRMHMDLSKPVITDECIQCKTCVETCPTAALSVSQRLVVDPGKCFGCGLCSEVCPEGAIGPRVNNLRVLLAEAAWTVTQQFGDRRMLFVNALLDLTDWCDCWDRPMRRLADDIGFLVSVDPVAVDKSSLDLVNQTAGSNVFRETHKLDPELQICRGEEIGMGTTRYTLVRID